MARDITKAVNEEVADVGAVPQLSKLQRRAAEKLTFTFGHINAEGMTKLETEDVLNKPITIIDFDYGVKKGEAFPVILLKEYPNCFMFGGMVLGDLLRDIENDAECMDELHATGLTVMLSTVKSKEGRAYTKVSVV